MRKMELLIALGILILTAIIHTVYITNACPNEPAPDIGYYVEDVSPPEQEQTQTSSCGVSIMEAPKDTYYNIPLAQELQDYTNQMCLIYGIDPEIVYGIMYVESRFQNVTSDNIHMGLMQVNKNYFPDLVKLCGYFQDIPESERNIYHDRANILAGIVCLDLWRNEALAQGYTSLTMALEAYNKGYAAFKDSSLFSQKYSRKVFEFIDTLEVRCEN